MSASQGHDCLTALPTELLIKVFAEVPIDSYLDLMHTSKGLRSFMKANAANICNEAIRSRHSVAAEYLKTELKSGWLVPTHERLVQADDFYFGYVSYRISISRFEEDSLLGELTQAVYLEELRETYIGAGSPGPQSLYFFESNILLICDKLHPSSRQCGSGAYCIQSLFKVYKGFEFRGYLNGYRDFLRRFNMVILTIENGKRMPPIRNKDKIPRALLWYYGLDNMPPNS